MLALGSIAGFALAAFLSSPAVAAEDDSAAAGYSISGIVTAPDGVDTAAYLGGLELNWTNGEWTTLSELPGAVSYDPGTGAFTISGLPEGTYTLGTGGAYDIDGVTATWGRTGAYSGGSGTGSGGGAVARELTVSVDLAGANTSGITVPGPAFGILSGSVTLAEGTSLAYADAYPFGLLIAEDEATGERFTSMVSFDGTFAIAPTTGVYTVTLWEDPSYTNALVVKTGVAVVTGGTTVLDLSYPPSTEPTPTPEQPADGTDSPTADDSGAATAATPQPAASLSAETAATGTTTGTGTTELAATGPSQVSMTIPAVVAATLIALGLAGVTTARVWKRHRRA